MKKIILTLLLTLPIMAIAEETENEYSSAPYWIVTGVTLLAMANYSGAANGGNRTDNRARIAFTGVAIMGGIATYRHINKKRQTKTVYLTQQDDAPTIAYSFTF